MSDNSYPSQGTPPGSNPGETSQAPSQSSPVPRQPPFTPSPAAAPGSFDAGSWTLTPEENTAKPQSFPTPLVTPYPTAATPQTSGPNFGTSGTNSYNGTNTANSTGFDPYGLNYQQVQPGIIPLRPLTLGDIYNGAFSAIRQAPAVMFGLVLALWAVLGGLMGTLFYFFTPDINSYLANDLNLDSTEFSMDGLLEFTESTILMSVIAGLLQMFIVFMTLGICVAGLGPLVLGRRPSVADAWQTLKGHVWGIVGYSLLLILGSALLLGLGLLPLGGFFLINIKDIGASLGLLGLTFLALLAVAVLSTWIYVKLVFAIPTAVMEDIGIIPALKRSWRLTKGSFWKIFGVILLTSLIVSFLTYGMNAVISLIISAATMVSQNFSVMMTISAFLGTIITGLVMPFYGAVLGLLYIDTRMRREGLAVSLLQAAQQG
ncbi:glycerophosphoryl diester phosphodiesterase membrane domain-containing protein [uncultured Mobiluncus sp.]|uniref:glycerophosphoryl diester phosphodiesterase membrane domain-containing protein n=1 Tax=uncultured Mobiluncus sp. TaxID=293425 RepID=UPI0025DB2ED6|nr:glycerophosphoryl diester phosphodiesterase membrane domain-containing protein [uncultured Mobiluncus sp.]